VAVKWLRRDGPPTREILSVAHEEEADLIVLGGKSQTSIKPSPQPGITRSLVKHAPCSVLVVR